MAAISIVEADPDLADLLDERSLERARREAITRVQHLSPGVWDAAAAHEPAEHHRGFLIIDGLLSRTVDEAEYYVAAADVTGWPRTRIADALKSQRPRPTASPHPGAAAHPNADGR